MDERAAHGRHPESGSSPRPAAEHPEDAAAVRRYQGETYYGLPAVKPSHYGWLIVGYFFVGGIAGSAQLMAAIVDLMGRNRTVVRAGRYLALAGVTISPVLLIADLHTPGRWYNMLRVFRRTSPMSIGSWTLTAFGTLSGAMALAQVIEDRGSPTTGRRLGRWLAVPAGAAGAMMSIYTGTLLAATSNPFWAAAPRLLPALFGTSAASTATAALTLSLEAAGAPEEAQRRLKRFALAAGGAELALAAATEQQWRRRGVDAPLRQPPLGAVFHLGVLGLGVAVPLVIHGVQALSGRRSRTASVLAAASTLLGGFLLRSVVVFAGNQSARRPQDYFQFTQPPAPKSG